MQEVLSVRLAQGVRLELLAAVGERQEQSALHWVWVCVTCRWV
jgi:tRNA splicing endonuclease